MAERPRKLRWRPWLRALHRDFGYLVVGFTLIYAVSGLAVNHIGDEGWDPNFTTSDATHRLGPLAGDTDAIVAAVAGQLNIDETPDDVYRASADRIDVTYAHRSLVITPTTGAVIDQGQKPRFLLRVANWLHLNRGKRAWTWFADGYAVLLLFLACSGMFMLPGKKGLIGRGGILVTIGILVPALFVAFSGGP
ncbi:MAG: hypothetical protein ACI9WU_001107 [Myxococcota bacterium]|jgi:hypothetical protein